MVFTKAPCGLEADGGGPGRLFHWLAGAEEHRRVAAPLGGEDTGFSVPDQERIGLAGAECRRWTSGLRGGRVASILILRLFTASDLCIIVPTCGGRCPSGIVFEGWLDGGIFRASSSLLDDNDNSEEFADLCSLHYAALAAGWRLTDLSRRACRLYIGALLFFIVRNAVHISRCFRASVLGKHGLLSKDGHGCSRSFELSEFCKQKFSNGGQE